MQRRKQSCLAVLYSARPPGSPSEQGAVVTCMSPSARTAAAARSVCRAPKTAEAQTPKGDMASLARRAVPLPARYGEGAKASSRSTWNGGHLPQRETDGQMYACPFGWGQSIDLLSAALLDSICVCTSNRIVGSSRFCSKRSPMVRRQCRLTFSLWPRRGLEGPKRACWNRRSASCAALVCQIPHLIALAHVPLGCSTRPGPSGPRR